MASIHKDIPDRRPPRRRSGDAVRDFGRGASTAGGRGFVTERASRGRCAHPDIPQTATMGARAAGRLRRRAAAGWSMRSSAGAGETLQRVRCKILPDGEAEPPEWIWIVDLLAERKIAPYISGPDGIQGVAGDAEGV